MFQSSAEKRRLAGCRRHPSAALTIAGEGENRSRHRLGVTRRRQRGAIVSEIVRNSTNPGGNDRKPRGHRLEQRVVGSRGRDGMNEDVRGSIARKECLAGNPRSQRRPRSPGNLADVFRFGQHLERDRRISGDDPVDNRPKQGEVAQPRADHQATQRTRRGSCGGPEVVGVDAVWHQVDSIGRHRCRGSPPGRNRERWRRRARASDARGQGSGRGPRWAGG